MLGYRVLIPSDSRLKIAQMLKTTANVVICIQIPGGILILLGAWDDDKHTGNCQGGMSDVDDQWLIAYGGQSCGTPFYL